MDLSKFDNAVSVAGEQASITVSPHGGHLLSWKVGDRQVFFVSDLTPYESGEAIRGGIPVCYPWFGRKAKPAHGWARISDFDVTADGSAITAQREFALEPPSELPGMLAKSRLTVRFEVVGRELIITALVTNTGDEPGWFDLALHSYFQVDDVANTPVRGLQGAKYSELGTEFVQDEDVLIPAPPLDRIYERATALEVGDLAITPRGYTHTVVWNPGPQHGIGDLREGDERSFLCVEAMHDGASTEPVDPGNTRQLVCRFRL